MSTDQVVMTARQRLHEHFRTLLAQSPLAGMSEWVATGAPPPRATLEIDGRPDLRWAFNQVWGFSVPCAEAVAALVELSPLVEIGAGSAYWTALLSAAGADIIATDLAPSGVGEHGFEVAAYAPVEQLGAVEAVERYPDRAVFCSWPTQGAEWCFEAVGALRLRRLFAIIAEPPDGIAGSTSLFELLEHDFNILQRVALPRLYDRRDSLTIYRRT
ncbi:MAG: hypothetical protein JF588_03735 [Caulobacterales bacterium]|nr:hypothetical protein [Caulobacterales bacterium]